VAEPTPNPDPAPLSAEQEEFLRRIEERVRRDFAQERDATQMRGYVRDARPEFPGARPQELAGYEFLNRQLIQGFEAAKAAAPPEAPKASIWPTILPAFITGITFVGVALGVFSSLTSTMNEIQKTNRELSVQITKVATLTEGLAKQFDTWQGRDDKRDDRLQRIEASLAKIEAKLEDKRR
jgi:hypothetical protein